MTENEIKLERLKTIIFMLATRRNYNGTGYMTVVTPHECEELGKEGIELINQFLSKERYEK